MDDLAAIDVAGVCYRWALTTSTFTTLWVSGSSSNPENLLLDGLPPIPLASSWPPSPRGRVGPREMAESKIQSPHRGCPCPPRRADG